MNPGQKPLLASSDPGPPQHWLLLPGMNWFLALKVQIVQSASLMQLTSHWSGLESLP